MNGTSWTLWIVYATNGEYGEMTQVYARDEQHARERARNWIEAHLHLPEVQFKAFPNGFQMARRWLPGTIRVGDEQENISYPGCSGVELYPG